MDNTPPEGPRRPLIHDAKVESPLRAAHPRQDGPRRAGADTRVDVIIPLSDLLDLDGASVIEDAWLRARAGEHGYLSGADAEAIACDAMIVPVVTGSPRWELISEMITLVAEACNHASAKAGTPLPPEAREALQYAMARLSIRFVSGPGALASALRRSLLLGPLNTKSAILDVGYADTIPTRSAGRSSPATRAAPGPAAATAAPPPATSTTSGTKDTAARPAPPTASCCASTTTTSASTGRLGNRTPARRIHPRSEPRREDHPPQPRTTTESPTHRLTPTPERALGLQRRPIAPLEAGHTPRPTRRHHLEPPPALGRRVRRAQHHPGRSTKASSERPGNAGRITTADRIRSTDIEREYDSPQKLTGLMQRVPWKGQGRDRGFFPHRGPAEHPGRGAQALRAVPRRLLARARPRRRLPPRLSPVDGRVGVARAGHARGGAAARVSESPRRPS